MSALVQNIVNDTVTSWIRFFVSASVAFVLTPLMIRELGVVDYGLWTLVFSVLGFLEMIDFGFYNAVIKYVSKCGALKDAEKINEILSTLFFTFVLLALVGMTIVGILALFFNQALGIPPELQNKSLGVLGILGARSLLFGLPLSLFRGVLFGERKITLSNFIGSVSILLYWLIATWVLKSGGGVISLAVVNLLQLVVEHVIYLFCSFYFLENLKISWSVVNFGFIKEAASFSIMQFLGNTSSLLTMRAAPIIIQLFLTLPFVTLYSLPLKVVSYLYIFIKHFTNVLGPLTARLHAQGKKEEIRELFLHSLKAIFAIGAGIVVGGSIFARDFLVLWVGKEFEDASIVFILLLVSLGVNLLQILCCQILSMAERHKELIPVFIWSSLINVILSVVLIIPFGINGVAFANLLSAIVGAWLSWRPLHEDYKVGIRDVLHWGLLPVLLPTFILVLAAGLLKGNFEITGFFTLAWMSALLGILFLFVYWKYSLKSAEKNMIIASFANYIK